MRFYSLLSHHVNTVMNQQADQGVAPHNFKPFTVKLLFFGPVTKKFYLFELHIFSKTFILYQPLHINS